MQIYVVPVIMTVLLSATVRGSNDDGGAERLVVDALGRTFTLGMLYDRRTDQIITGHTLWNHDQLHRNLSTREIRSSEYNVKMRDSLEDKADLMNIEAAIKASFLGGLVSVSGSAKYLDDKKMSRYDARITLKYDARTKFEQLTMAHLNRSNIRYPELLNNGEATHVVVGIEYGMQAYFIFEKRMTHLSNQNEVYGELRAVVDALPTISIDAHGKVELNEELQQKTNDLHVKFFGDFILPHNPTTFEEAVKIYKELPNFVIGQDAQSVPMKVYLAPLQMLDPAGTFAVIQDISKSLISNVVTIMQELEDGKEEAQDLSRSVAARDFNFIDRNVNWFLNLLRQYAQQFQSDISPLLVEIRGSGREESELSAYLQQHLNSPFSKENLEAWLHYTEEESLVLESFVNLLRNITFCKHRGDYIRQILTNDKVISLNMYFPDISDHVLNGMENFLEGRNFHYSDNSEMWFHSWLTMANIQISMEDFLYFYEVNKQDSTIKFIYTLLPPQNHTQHFPYADIKGIYTQGRRRHEYTLLPPGQPINIRETVENNTVNLQWEHPLHGLDFIDHYKIVLQQRGDLVEYRYQTDSIQTEFQIATPDSSVPYDAYIYGACRIGRTASSEVLHLSGVNVRLVGGAEICSPRKAHSGRVEVLRNHIWGTICATTWTDKEAGVACRMMGFSGGVARATTPELQGTGQIWMMNVICDGSEENLDLCSFDWAPEGACNHSMDAVVECYGGAPTRDASTPEQCTVNTLQELLTLARSNLNMARQELNNERETRLHAMTNLEGTVSSLENRLSSYFSVAFSATISQNYPTIYEKQNGIFDTVTLNRGNGYNSRTGVFTVPDGTGGLCYISTHLVSDGGEYTRFIMYRNNEQLCGIEEDFDESNSDNGSGSCSITVQLNAGDRIFVRRNRADNNTPLWCGYRQCGFTGFLMKPTG